MTTRLLPPAEWPKLAGTEAETVWPVLDPGLASIVVIEQDSAIVGCHILMWVLHAECLWIAPAHRGKASVARRLWTAVQQAARATGVHTIWTAAIDDRVRRLLTHVGAQPLPVDHYVVPLKR